MATFRKGDVAPLRVGSHASAVDCSVFHGVLEDRGDDGVWLVAENETWQIGRWVAPGRLRFTSADFEVTVPAKADG